MSPENRSNIMKFYEYLSKNELGQMHEATLQLLENTGIYATSERFLGKCAELGLKVDGHRVYFPRALVEKGLSTAPSHFSTWGRDKKYEIKWGEKKAYNHTCVGTPFILDVETGRKRDVLMKDLEDFVRVADALPNTDIVSCIFPQDVPTHAVVTMQTAAMVKNTTKPLRICIESAHETNFIIDVLAAAVGGMDELRANPIAYLEISSVSPLSYAEGPGNGLIDVVEAGLPLGVIPCPMMGATGPMTLIGCVTMHNAEIVAGIVIAQLLRPGAPVIMSPRVTFMEMSSGLGLWAAPEMGLAAIASAQMALYYDIPCTVTGFSCASKINDEQAAFETFYNSFLPAVGGVDVLGASGSLDNALISSYEKLIMDDEITSMIQRTLRGDAVNADTLAVEVVDAVCKAGAGSNFLSQKHTLRHVRTELWQPLVSDRQSYGAWEAEAKSYPDRARELAKKLLAEHRTDPLSPDALAKVEAAVQAAIDAGE